MNEYKYTTEPIPQTIEADLIRVRTIKRKYAESLLEPIGTAHGTKADDVEFLAYLHEHDAILARRKDNGHLALIRAINYYSSLETAPGASWPQTRDRAYALVHSLPQLFLD